MRSGKKSGSKSGSDLYNLLTTDLIKPGLPEVLPERCDEVDGVRCIEDMKTQISPVVS